MEKSSSPDLSRQSSSSLPDLDSSALDYVTMALHMSRLFRGGKFQIGEPTKAGPDHCLTWSCEIFVQLPNGNRILGRGAGKTAKNARHDAARDFLKCSIAHHAALLVSNLDADTYYCDRKFRPDPSSPLLEESRGSASPALPARSPDAVASVPISAVKKEKENGCTDEEELMPITKEDLINLIKKFKFVAS